MFQAAKAILFFLMLPSGIWKKSNLLHLQMYGHAPKKDLPSERNTSTLEKCSTTYSNYVVLVSESIMWSDNFKRQNLPTLLLQSAHTSFPLSIGKIILSKIFENSPKNKNCRQKIWSMIHFKEDEEEKTTKENLNSGLFAGKRKFHFTGETFQISQGLIQFSNYYELAKLYLSYICWNSELCLWHICCPNVFVVWA